MLSASVSVFCRLPKRAFLHMRNKIFISKRSIHPVVYFSGIQPTGVPHLGNYFGFIKPWLDIQEHEAAASSLYLSVVDYHSLSLGPVEPNQMKENVLKMAAGLIACGVLPERTVLFQQSAIQEHTNLMFLLGMLQTVTQLKRLSHYKEKSARFKHGNVPLNLFIYPVLQTADILLYKGTHVPVGEDQTQHLRLSRDLAANFNLTFKVDYFPVPVQITSVNSRIKSLRDPTKKMSKSDPAATARIDLNDSRELIFEKCSKALSDFRSNITYEPESRPAISNLVSLYCAVNNVATEKAIEECAAFDTKSFKMKLAEDLDRLLSPIRERYENLLENPKLVVHTLNEGAEKAREAARRTMSEVKDILGLNL